MARELRTLKTVEVKSIDWSMNQAQTLEFEETCLEQNRQLHMADEVVYTDVDLGEIFHGWVSTEKGKKKSGDEGGNGMAADLGRCLAKQKAYLMCLDACPPMADPPALLGTTKFRIETGTTVSAAINLVLKCIGPLGLNLLGTVHIEAAIGNLTLSSDIDKGGAYIADWLNTILDQTEGGTWYTVNSDVFVIDFYGQPACPLAEADFGQLMPNPRNNSVMEGREVGESSDQKYRGVVVEGAGAFRRVSLTTFGGSPSCSPRQGEFVGQIGAAGPGTGVENPANIWTFNYRWYLPENVVIGNYFDAFGQAASGAFLAYLATYTEDMATVNRHEQGYSTAGPLRDLDPFAFDVGPTGGVDRGPWNPNLSYAINDVISFQGLFYIAVAVNLSQVPSALNTAFWGLYIGTNPRFGRYYLADGWTIANMGRPAPPSFDPTQYLARYTIFEGPVVGTKYSTDVRLKREGEFTYQREDLFKYFQEEFRDPFSVEVPGDTHTPRLTYHPVTEIHLDVDPTPTLTAIATALFRRKCGSHFTGTIPVHISPALKNVRVGQYIQKYGIDCRIRNIKFDVVNRTANLEVSGLPIRDFVTQLNLNSARVIQGGLNWVARNPLLCSQIGSLPSLVLNQNCEPVIEASKGFCNQIAPNPDSPQRR